MRELTLFVVKVYTPHLRSTTSYRIVANNIKEVTELAVRYWSDKKVTYIHEIGPVYYAQ